MLRERIKENYFLKPTDPILQKHSIYPKSESSNNVNKSNFNQYKHNAFLQEKNKEGYKLKSSNANLIHTKSKSIDFYKSSYDLINGTGEHVPKTLNKNDRSHFKYRSQKRLFIKDKSTSFILGDASPTCLKSKKMFPEKSDSNILMFKKDTPDDREITNNQFTNGKGRVVGSKKHFVNKFDLYIRLT
jgi:hypothetical protein